MTRLAVRIGDLSKYPERRETEKTEAISRRDMQWNRLEELLLFPDTARQVRRSRQPAKETSCTMCGEFCAMQKGRAVFADAIGGDKAPLQESGKGDRR